MSALAAGSYGIEVCGVEEDPQGVRVYVGPRYRGRYFVVREKQADYVRREWAASFRGHLLMDRRQVPYLLTEYRP